MCVLKIFVKSQVNTCAKDSFFKSFRFAPIQVCSCQFCKIFKNIFFLKTSSGYFFKMFPNLKKRRKKYTMPKQGKNQLETTVKKKENMFDQRNFVL